MDEDTHQSDSIEELLENGVSQRDLQVNLRKGPSPKSWALFFVLLGLTLFTTYLAGGKLYAVSLFLILGTHEFGHYFAGVRNGVRTTLPLFIPAPPGLFLFGTFGAMIAIKDPIPNRRVLMEIGAAGPIAGFVVAVPTLIIGLFLSDVVPPTGERGVALGSSVVMVVFSKFILGVTPLSLDFNINLHPIAYSGWVGLFITALNLFPIFKKQIEGFVGISSAPEFLEKLMWKNFTKKIKKIIMTHKIYYLKKGEWTYPITKQLIMDGRKNKVLSKKINLKIPITLFHGLKDKIVPLMFSKKILKIFPKAKKKLIKIKNGDHSLSKKNNLEKICKELNRMIVNQI